MSKPSMSRPNVFLRQAALEDVDSLLSLLNQCYREDVGWTNEAHLVEGIRTTAQEIEAVINAPRHYLSPVAVKPPTSGGGYKATHTVVRSR